MISRFKLRYTQTFLNKQSALAAKNYKIAQRVAKALELLSIDPFTHSLHSHKVNAINVGESYSSSVTGDHRIIWNYDSDEQLVFLVLNLGTHSGKSKVYK